MTHTNGLPIVPLGDVLSHRKEFVRIDDLNTYKRCRVQLHAKGVVLRDEVEGAVMKTKSQQVCRTDELLVAEIDAKVGGYGLVPAELDGAIVSSHYFLFPCTRERIEPQFLAYFVRTPYFRDQVAARGSTNYAAIRPQHVLQYQIPLPPLSEQRRIVAKIDRLAARIDESRALRNLSAIVMRTVMGNAIGRLFPEQHTTSLGDYVVDDCYGTSEKSYDEPIGVPILRMGNIQNGTLDVRELKHLQVSERDREKWILRKGDILVNRTNSAELVGKCAVFDLEGDWGFASYLIRIRLDATRADPRLVARYINSPVGRAYMFRERKQMTGQANVNSKKLKALPLSLPPLPEQRRIVAYLDGLQAKVDELKRLQADSAAELDALLPAILDRAFKGQLSDIDDRA
jgi:type I restriction enzyme S subunit